MNAADSPSKSQCGLIEMAAVLVEERGTEIGESVPAAWLHHGRSAKHALSTCCGADSTTCDRAFTAL